MRADPALIRQVQAVRDEALRASRPGAVVLDGVRVNAMTESQCIRHILASLTAGQGGWIITPNLDHLRRARLDVAYRAMLAEADMVVADGMPLVWASWLQGTPLPERVAGSSLVQTLSESAALRGDRLFLIGGDPDASTNTVDVLQRRFPGLPVAGHYKAPYGFERDPAEMATLRRQLREAQPAIVYVALGSPKQEHLIRQLRSEAPRAWWLGVGISFSFVCGRVKRAPRWMQRAGLEWLHRLAQEPTRLGRRYLVDGPPYAASLLGGAMLRRCVESTKGRGRDARAHHDLKGEREASDSTIDTNSR